MKKSILFILLILAVSVAANAQKFALIDMEYILENIPAYTRDNEQLNELSQKWQNEIDAVSKEAQQIYKDYQAQYASLTDGQRTKKEEEIIAKEKGISELKRKYFGPEGELAKRRQAAMKPIQDDIYEAVKEIAERKDYSTVIDRASATSIIFASPHIDISNEVLTKLGYPN
ncbi:MAG: OmpH family outer membrane protein [Mediterranea sp.]|jgi:outer membrane protein|nr:OmpH family outer membrane protein [Mediterranea sp.]